MRLLVILLLVAGVALGTVKPASARSNHLSWYRSGGSCVHSHEGSWHDSGAPYYGGFQMDYTFMRHYGGWILAHHGTANHWPIRTQILVAYRGFKKQGWYAWKNTASMCGLI